jgi:hypothetical protein
VNEAATAARIAMMSAGVPPTPIVAEHMDTGVPEILASSLVALAAEGVAPSPFPYGGDQWISAWATSWATMALVQAVPVPVTRAER